MALMYNKTLSEERDIAREVAEAEGVVFADVITPMIEVMTKAKEKYGKAYHLAGGDGVHPDKNGHLVMAYAFLKALGCNGDLGQISVDLAATRFSRRQSTAAPRRSKSKAFDTPSVSRGIRPARVPPAASSNSFRSMPI